jgi:hypothetical protein
VGIDNFSPTPLPFRVTIIADVICVMERMWTVVTFVAALFVAGTMVYAAYSVVRLAVLCVRWTARAIRSWR